MNPTEHSGRGRNGSITCFDTAEVFPLDASKWGCDEIAAWIHSELPPHYDKIAQIFIQNRFDGMTLLNDMDADALVELGVKRRSARNFCKIVQSLKHNVHRAQQPNDKQASQANSDLMLFLQGSWIRLLDGQRTTVNGDRYMEQTHTYSVDGDSWKPFRWRYGKLSMGDFYLDAAQCGLDKAVWVSYLDDQSFTWKRWGARITQN